MVDTKITDLTELTTVNDADQLEIVDDVAGTPTSKKITVQNLHNGVTISELSILDGATVSTAELNILDGATVTASELNILDGATLTTTELNYVDGVTSAIQTQLDTKIEDVVDDTTPQLGGDLDTNQNSIIFDSTPDTDNTAIGVKATFTAGEAMSFNDIGYMKSDGKVWKADASASTTMPGLFFCLDTISADASGEFLLMGIVRDDNYAWTVGGAIYVSETSGNLTQTIPTTSAAIVQKVGYATNADRFIFNPSLDLIENS